MARLFNPRKRLMPGMVKQVALLLILAMLMAACGQGRLTKISQATTAPIETATAAPSEAFPTPTEAVRDTPPAANTPTLAEPAPTQSPEGHSCAGELSPTPSSTEGPYYTPDTPERTSLLEEGMTGTRLLLTGYVLTTDCKPVAGAFLDFWQADDQGEYDNQGYQLRGHQFSDENGRYTLETILPGLYPGRPRHIHVIVQAPDQPALTTQLYFPGDPGNETGSFFDPALLVEIQETPEGLEATFNFVLGLR